MIHHPILKNSLRQFPSVLKNSNRETAALVRSLASAHYDMNKRLVSDFDEQELAEFEAQIEDKIIDLIPHLVDEIRKAILMAEKTSKRLR